jgi:hypothetical protein
VRRRDQLSLECLFLPGCAWFIVLFHFIRLFRFILSVQSTLPFHLANDIIMQLGLSFSALLAGLLAVSSVEAAPLARRGKSVSLPLERTHGLRAGVPVDVVRTISPSTSIAMLIRLVRSNSRSTSTGRTPGTPA